MCVQQCKAVVITVAVAVQPHQEDRKREPIQLGRGEWEVLIRVKISVQTKQGLLKLYAQAT